MPSLERMGTYSSCSTSVLFLPLPSAIKMFSLQTKSTVHFGQSRVRFSSCFWRLLHIPKSETRPRHSCLKRKSWSGKKVIKYWPNPTMLLLFLSLGAKDSSSKCKVLHWSCIYANGEKLLVWKDRCWEEKSEYWLAVPTNMMQPQKWQIPLLGLAGEVFPLYREMLMPSFNW